MTRARAGKPYRPRFLKNPRTPQHPFGQPIAALVLPMCYLDCRWCWRKGC
jgi:hypothetical protein